MLLVALIYAKEKFLILMVVYLKSLLYASQRGTPLVREGEGNTKPLQKSAFPSPSPPVGFPLWTLFSLNHLSSSYCRLLFFLRKTLCVCWQVLIVERRGRRSLQVHFSSANNSKKIAMKFAVLKAKVGDKGEG